MTAGRFAVCLCLVVALGGLTSCGGGGGGGGGSSGVSPAATAPSGVGQGTTPATPSATADAHAKAKAALEAWQAAGVKFVSEIGERQGVQYTDAKSGDIVTFAGPRDVNGTLLAVDGMNLVRSDGSRSRYEVLSADQRVMSDSNVSMSVARKPDGSYDLVITELASGKTTTINSSKLTPAPAAKAGAKSASKGDLVLRKGAGPGQIPANVTVTTCGAVEDRTDLVYVGLKDGLGAPVGTYRAERTGPAQWVAYLPSPEARVQEAYDTVRGLIEGASQVFDALCSVEQQMPFAYLGACTQLTGYVASSGFGTAFTGHFAAACGAFATMAMAACKIQEIALPTPEAIPPGFEGAFPTTLKDALIKMIPEDLFLFKAQAYLVELSGDLNGPVVELSRNPASVALTVEDHRDCPRSYSGPFATTGTGQINGTNCSGTYGLVGTATINLKPPASITIEHTERFRWSCYAADIPGKLTIPLTRSGNTLNGQTSFTFTCAYPCTNGASSYTANLTIDRSDVLAPKIRGTLSSTTGSNQWYTSTMLTSSNASSSGQMEIPGAGPP